MKTLENVEVKGETGQPVDIGLVREVIGVVRVSYSGLSYPVRTKHILFWEATFCPQNKAIFKSGLDLL